MIEQVLPKTNKAPKGKKQSTETFSFNDPNAQNVALAGDFTDWEDNAIPMKKQKNGSWKATVSLEPGTYEYRFLVDGQWQDDMDCPDRRPNAFGAENCIRQVR
jgi:1,4-alpha-glucan branching enzyme